MARPRAELRVHVLDVGDGAAVEAFAREIRARHRGVDIVFSNAAARLTPRTPSAELVRPFSDPAPRRAPAGRGERVRLPAPAADTLAGVLRHRRDDARRRRRRRARLARRGCGGTAAEEGWPDWINIPSKVGQVAAVRVLARERRAADSRDGALVAAVCPGLIDTAASRPWFDDMSGGQTPAEAAVAPLRLALDPVVDPRLYGELVQFGKIIPWR